MPHYTGVYNIRGFNIWKKEEGQEKAELFMECGNSFLDPSDPFALSLSEIESSCLDKLDELTLEADTNDAYYGEDEPNPKQ